MIEDALQVFDEMKKVGVCPSLETWNCLLLSSIQEGYTNLVWELYGEMMQSGIVADLDTASCLIQAFCLDRNVTEGYHLLQLFLNKGYVPHKFAFDKLLFEFILDQKYDRVPGLLRRKIYFPHVKDFNNLLINRDQVYMNGGRVFWVRGWKVISRY
ncbi:pentatricopeptide repeat-containing protein At5g18950-like [Lactuca sativa]|uniref:pentatricopeptide repeat-containing protein At5g18950-like n=1 Tax=Lactuca sativa TaxID=4236 RepID=UPI0022B00D00|nr:pentatricopeptide repeat-containing protein At5g18950-like [Lactuca sativa]